MRADIAYIKRKFNEFNDLCFGGELPPLPVRLSNAGRALGLFVHPRVYPAWKPRGRGECHLRISTRFDLPENEVEDTIIHEMIHYYIWYKKIPDNAPHGNAFRSKMAEINRLHGRRLSVSHRSSAGQLDSDRHHRNNYICVQHWKKGGHTLTVCARTCIFDIHRIMTMQPELESVEWYWSMDPWFNRFPVSRTAKMYLLSEEDYRSRFATATPCECDGHMLRPVRR